MNKETTSFSNSRRSFIKTAGGLLLSASFPFRDAFSGSSAFPAVDLPIGNIFLVKEGGFNNGPSVTTYDPISGRTWSEGDWTNDNCLNAAEGFNLFRYVLGPGDVLVWDSQHWEFNKMQTFGKMPSIPGLYRLWSKYLDPLTASFSQINPNERLFQFNNDGIEGGNIEIEFKGMTLTRSDTTAWFDGSLGRINRDISGLYFENVRIGGFNTTGGGRLFSDSDSVGSVERRIGFYNSEFYSLGLSGKSSGIVTARANTDIELAGVNLRSVHIQTGNSNTELGLFRARGGLRVNGMGIDDVSINGPGDSTIIRGIFSHENASERAAVIENIIVRNSSISNGNIQSFIIQSGGKHAIRKLELYNCHAKPSLFSKNLGFAALSIGSNPVTLAPALGIYDDIYAESCSAQFGLLAYASGGGRIIASNLKAVDCEVETGLVYSGGAGDTEIDGLIVKDCRSTSSVGTSLYAHNAYRPNKTPPEARAKLVSVRGLQSEGNRFIGGGKVDSGYGADLWVRSYNPQDRTTLDLVNFTLKSPELTYDIVLDTTSTGLVHLNLSRGLGNRPIDGAIWNIGDLATVDVGSYAI